MNDIVFYILAAIMVLGAVATVSLNNILHAAVALIATFLTTAILYLVLNAEFVALAQIMMYVGGVVIFAVFTILLTTRLGDEHFEVKKNRKLGAIAISATLIAIFSRVFIKSSDYLTHSSTTEKIADIEQIGMRLVNINDNGFLVPFELISVLLLVTMIGAIVIARKDSDDDVETKEEVKSTLVQNIFDETKEDK